MGHVQYGVAMKENQTESEGDEQNPLLELLMPEAKLKILNAFIQLGGDKENPTRLCEIASVNTATWYRHRDDLIDTYGIIEEAGKAGNSPLYRVDMDHPIVKRLDEIHDLAAEQRNVTDSDHE